jgi:pSer/pThr/pTyr-binding forkhead associated (FHA) protein
MRSSRCIGRRSSTCTAGVQSAAVRLFDQSRGTSWRRRRKALVFSVNSGWSNGGSNTASTQPVTRRRRYHFRPTLRFSCSLTRSRVPRQSAAFRPGRPRSGHWRARPGHDPRCRASVDGGAGAAAAMSAETHGASSSSGMAPRQAHFEGRDDAWWCVDDGSMDGLYIDDQRTTGRAPLAHGTRIGIGSTSAGGEESGPKSARMQGGR